jgi:hypothetical protein
MEAAHDWLVCFGDERSSGDDNETLLALFLTNSEPISDQVFEPILLPWDERLM